MLYRIIKINKNISKLINMLIKKVIAIIIFILICTSISVFSKEYKSLQTVYKNNVKVNNILKKETHDEIPNVYYDFLKNFDTQGKEYYYSFIELENYEFPILALSDGVYQDETKAYVALGTSIYYYEQGKVNYFGELYSGGTAYPIRADETGIFTAENHGMAKYNLDEEKQVLHQMEACKVYFNTKGKATYIATVGNINELITFEEFVAKNEKYANARVAYFTKLFINEN